MEFPPLPTPEEFMRQVDSVAKERADEMADKASMAREASRIEMHEFISGLVDDQLATMNDVLSEAMCSDDCRASLGILVGMLRREQYTRHPITTEGLEVEEDAP